MQFEEILTPRPSTAFQNGNVFTNRKYTNRSFKTRALLSKMAMTLRIENILIGIQAEILEPILAENSGCLRP